MKRTIAIGDVHGCVKTLRFMVEDRLGIDQTDHVILLGDYIDRGPSSRQVLDYILHLVADGYNVTPLRGNHDDLLLRARLSTTWFENWMRNGAETTLRSFGVCTVGEIGQQYIDLIESFPLHCQTTNFFCVHAALNTSIEDPLSDTHTMLFKRTEDVDREKIGGRTLLCGHTPQTRDRIYERLAFADKVIIDNGCVYAGEEGMGHLCALDLDTREPIFVPNRDIC